jgi:hypothetical protein
MLISYEEFGRLRLRDFYPEGVRLSYSDDGFECRLGPSGFEGFTTTYFAWPEAKSLEIGEISLDLREEYQNELPPEVGARILASLKLPLRRGMTEGEVITVLGHPERIDRGAPEFPALFFRCPGDSGAAYRVECNFQATRGLTGVGIVRDDLREHEP